MSKEDWIYRALNKWWIGADVNAIEFISKWLFLFDDDSIEQEIVCDLFANGYCFYFAYLLQIELLYGEVKWQRMRGHIMWTYNDMPYDIYGVYDDSQVVMCSLYELEDKLDLFKHVYSKHDVIRFISTFKYRRYQDVNPVKYGEVVEKLFSGELGKYFPWILSIAFGRGEPAGSDWIDTDGKVYNIYGEVKNG